MFANRRSVDRLTGMADKLAQLAASPELLTNALDHEAAQEAAASLGHTGRRVELALNGLRRADADEADYEKLLSKAAVAVHHYFIQREIMGMRRHNGVIREYDIPRQVLVRLGASN